MESNEKLFRMVLISTFLVFLFLTSISFIASAKESKVDDNGEADFVSIQDAVNNSFPGDIIFVLPGTYNEIVYVGTQNISILSQSGNPEDTSVKAFKINENNITVNGFSIQEGLTLTGYAHPGNSGSHYPVKNCTVKNNKFLKHGIDGNQCYNATVERNIFLGDSSGISSEFHNCTFSDNVFFKGNISIYAGREPTCNIILNNTFLKGGISLAGSDENRILKNNIFSGIDNGYGIVLSESGGNTIDNNSISSTICAIFMPFICGHNYVTNNTITSNTVGIQLAYLSDGTIKSNTISKNNIGISIGESSTANITNNTISKNEIGISAGSSSLGINVVGNVIELNKKCGIYLDQTPGEVFLEGKSLIFNNFFNNTINFFNYTEKANYEWGIHNAAFNITKTSGTSIVGGPYSGGNFWAKPDGTGFSRTCVDSDKDGICDLPYNINESDFDYLPLSSFPVEHADSELILREIQITDNESDQTLPDIYGDRIIWIDGPQVTQDHYFYSDIYIYNLSTSGKNQITTDGLDASIHNKYNTNPHVDRVYISNISPRIYNDRIVWTRVLGYGSNLDIYMYDLSSLTKTPISTGGLNLWQGYPEIYGDRIVWTEDRNGNYDIYMYNLSTSRETRISNSGQAFLPRIYGDLIVWEDRRNGNFDIYTYNFSESKETRITTDDSNQEFPAVYDNTIVWVDRRGEVSEVDTDYSDICVYDILTSTETQLTKGSVRVQNPDIYCDKVVWQDERNGDSDIYMYDLSTSRETRITADKSDQQSPAIYGNRIVWQDERNGNSDIYICIFLEKRSESEFPVAKLNTNVTCGDAPLSVLFTDLSENVKSRSWDLDSDGTIDSTDASFVHVYPKPGNYTVRLTAVNEIGIDSKKVTITVLAGENSGRGHKASTRASPEPATNVDVKEISEALVTAGKEIGFNFTQNSTCVVYMSFDAEKSPGKTEATAEMLKKKSDLVPETPSGEVYRFFNIWCGNNGIITSKDVKDPVVCFKIEKTWLHDRKIDRNSITLSRYSGKEWVQLPVSLSGEDKRYLYFTAKTPGFSFFAITGKAAEKGSEAENETGTDTRNPLQDSKASETEPEAETGKESGTGKSTNMPGFEVVCGVVCLLAVFRYKRK
ncbi:PGF-pre-PGF domain-containing protein [Methanosarcina sp. MSH10X1]|uniref:PGF-pre-PGF domain-containing protein n=1 Tax=Methanosarcina sp. MSH10X1 TaxID=2507075 RepID=UPI0013E3BAEF|nr:PGF-pre-PGF domain-containing protein [Methanosarcina sp. MSH10X1]